ncbi:alpha-1,2-fucosyltransferase [Moorena producens JHB]|uniref:Alpha-1,2-fucosyltransferase n=1 Tax=Moorena producens (strain JHB) TaxID=1454205 RepID=A0A1D9G4L8_MOOP1|nr:alpha-1,2-fucosyltransferase [Moorena producens]AOY82556.2 alpha-1,2-fucosyltransferase [Moorena producens JHB]
MFIIVRKTGQLGNRMMLFANFMAFAMEYNLKVINPAFDEYAVFFEGTHNDFFCRYPAQKSVLKGNSLKLKRNFHRFVYHSTRLLVKDYTDFKFLTIKILRDTGVHRGVIFDENFANFFKNNELVFIHGFWFRNPVLFLKYSETIRKFFTPLKQHAENINKLVTNLKKSCDILVGVHIRQGDYKKLLGAKYLYTTDDYVNLMKKTERLFPGKKVKFLICSNVPQDRDKFSKLDFAFANNHIVEDMYSLAQCDYIIGPPSSYNMWAGFYGRVPLYWIEDPNADISLDSFQIYDVPLDVAPPISFAQ